MSARRRTSLGVLLALATVVACGLWGYFAGPGGGHFAVSGGSGRSSHLDAHLRAEPPARLLEPLGDESRDSVVKGLDPHAEGVLADALLAAGLHSRLLRVAVAATDGMVAALVKLQAGDKQSGLFVLNDLEADMTQAIEIAFRELPQLDHLDVWATVPSERESREFHRPVLTLSVSRAQVADVLSATARADDVLPRCGCLRVDDLFTQYAIDGSQATEVQRLGGEVLQGLPLTDTWTEFGARARRSGELDSIPRDGLVGAIVEGDPYCGKVALTIDDGPHPLTTPLVLDVLRREGVRATFFLVGENVEQFPELVRMIVRDGHEVGNHTYSHVPLSELNPRGVWSQLRGCDQAIERVTGTKPHLMRPPGGSCSELALRVTDRLGYQTVLWTANTGDWIHQNRAQIVSNGLSHVRSGSIILMHQGDLWSLDALPEIIQGIRRAGLEPGTVSEAVGDQPVQRWEPAELVALAKRAHTDRYEWVRTNGG